MPVMNLPAWSEGDFCLAVSAGSAGTQLGALAHAVYDRVCRTDFRAPGFCLLDLGSGTSSQELRRVMMAFKAEMRSIHRARTGRDLVLLSAARFDQQVTTKPHRDGGPDECFLMLGYEPTAVQSELAMSDYSRCAHDMGLTPAEFLEQHNPMLTAGQRLLEKYTTRVVCFGNRSHQILFINNSSAPYADGALTWQGVLHTALIPNPDEAQRRVVNSVMVASVAQGTLEAVSAAEQAAFVSSNAVRRSGYDKPNLADDN